MSETDTDLPKTLIKRIVKRHLSQIDKGDTKRDTQINKDALLAFSESAKVFINYVTATANDICKESKRQTISVDDIFRALEDTDFVDLIAPLKQSLEVFKKDTKEKNQKKAEAKKRKAEQIEQQQQEPSTDDVADMDQGDPVCAFASNQQPAQMEARPPAEQQPVHPHPDVPMQPPSTFHQSAVKLNEHGGDNQQKQSPSHLSDLPMTSSEACQGIVPMQPPPQLTNLVQVPQAAALPHM
ncbi:hypothetical protein WJX77_001031 [Trebouxia sp. C0004]